MKHLTLALLVSLVLTSSLVSAGAQGPKPKLEAPENVSCLLTPVGVVVSFDLVPEANAYQFEYVCVNALGVIKKESVFSLAPPIPLVEEDCTIIAVHVRGLPPPKKEGGPLQGSGPKGEWSELCVVPQT